MKETGPDPDLIIRPLQLHDPSLPPGHHKATDESFGALFLPPPREVGDPAVVVLPEGPCPRQLVNDFPEFLDIILRLDPEVAGDLLEGEPFTRNGGEIGQQAFLQSIDCDLPRR